MKYYLAYGMNTNLAEMEYRCPAAESLGKVVLDNHKLAFKVHCDAEYKPGASMECALWRITDKCEQALDQLEGYPFYYDKKEVIVEHNGKTLRPMIYYMKDNTVLDMPSEHYLKMVTEGYREHNMNIKQIIDSLEEVAECI